MLIRRQTAILVLIGGLLWIAGCKNDVEHLRLATTTSTENSGLLAELLPLFEAQCSCKVDVIAVGTGHALKLGSGGDVDLVMVHAPDLELAFVDEGSGVDRRTFMQNDFVIVGPPDDPAGLSGAANVATAMTQLVQSDATFVSRGDESGTHYRELGLWELAGIAPAGDHYLDAGQGMGAVLTMAGDKQAYTLTDRGTFLAYERDLGLVVLVEGDPPLLNPYSVIAVNPDKVPWVKRELAGQLTEWLCSTEGQGAIGEFRVSGTQLFTPIYGVGS